MVGCRAAIPVEAGYRYDTGDTKTYSDMHFEALQSWEQGQGGLLLKELIFVDRSGRVPYLIKEHSEEMGNRVG